MAKIGQNLKSYGNSDPLVKYIVDHSLRYSIICICNYYTLPIMTYIDSDWDSDGYRDRQFLLRDSDIDKLIDVNDVIERGN